MWQVCDLFIMKSLLKKRIIPNKYAIILSLLLTVVSSLEQYDLSIPQIQVQVENIETALSRLHCHDGKLH